MNVKQLSISSSFFLVTTSVFAVNPILHELTIPFPSQISPSTGSATAMYTFTNNMPWTMTLPFVVKAHICKTSTRCSAVSSEFSFDDQCTGQKLAPKASCTYSVTLTAQTRGEKEVLVSYEGYDHNVVKVRPALSTTVIKNNIPATHIGVNYAPNHYPDGALNIFNTQGVFYTAGNPATTNIHAELVQLKAAGFQSVRMYGDLPAAYWIETINQASALNMNVIYEALIPENGGASAIALAQAELTAVITAVGSAQFSATVLLVFAGHENYDNTNEAYLQTAVTALQTTLDQNNAGTVPVSIAFLSEDLTSTNPSIIADMSLLINSFGDDAPIAMDTYPYQWGIPNPDSVNNASTEQSIAWNYKTIAAEPYAQAPNPTIPPRILLMAESGWSGAIGTQPSPPPPYTYPIGYACDSVSPPYLACQTGVSYADVYYPLLYAFVNNPVNSSGLLAFEAYDEPSKASPPSNAENFYGVFDSNCFQKSAVLVPNNIMVAATGCQGYTDGALLVVNGTTPPAQPAFTIVSTNPAMTINVPSTLSNWPFLLVYNGATITLTGSVHTCSFNATVVSATPNNYIQFVNTASCAGQGVSFIAGTSSTNARCQLPNDF